MTQPDGRKAYWDRERPRRMAARIPDSDRFWAKVQRGSNNECWMWTAATVGKGYGTLGINGGREHILAHRFSYQLHIGPIPDGLIVCHHCDTPACVNPAHLYAGSYKDNMRDMDARGRRGRPKHHKTHCIRGHEFTLENTRKRKNGTRNCKACKAVYRKPRWPPDPAIYEPVIAYDCRLLDEGMGR